MLHMHSTPTQEDMIEAKRLFFEFHKTILQNPLLLNPNELNIGKTLAEVKDVIDTKLKTQTYDMIMEHKKDTKQGRVELLIEHIQEINKTENCQTEELKQWAMKELNYSLLEFEKEIEKLLNNGVIFQPKNGELRVL